MSQTGTKSNQDDTAGEGEKKIKMIPDNSHGPNFEWRLLTLFCVRALGAGYKFEVTKEWEDLGGKFDDVIIRYRVVDDTLEGNHWRYRFLQSKHKMHENEKIKAIQLLEDNDRGDFSSPKYFRSFCKMRRRGEDIHDCILCTNIGFDFKDVQKNGIELVSINDQPEDILEFGPQQKTLRYKLKFTEELRRKVLNEWSDNGSDIDILAKALKTCALEKQTTDTRTGVFSSYHVALVEEKVIDSATKKFHEDFVNGKESLSNGAQQLRQTLSDLPENDWKSWKFKLNNKFGKRRSDDEIKNPLSSKISEEDVDAFLEKLVFVVNTPNVNNLKAILQAQDMSKYYPREECEQQTIRLLDEMQNEFSNKKVGYWLKPERSKKILLAGVTTTSLKYQKELDNEVGFNDVAIDKMADKLRALLANNKRIERITTPAPKHTAVKVVSAIRKLPEYDRSGSFLMTILGCLEDKDDKERWKNILKLKTDSHHLLIVVCENETPDADDYADLVPGENLDNKVFFIGRNGVAGMMDDITFEELNEKFQNAVLEKTITFQGTVLTVGDLVGNEPDKVIDYLSIEELLSQKKDVNIPRPDTSECEESLYIKRQLTMVFHESFENKLAERLKCTINELHEKCRITPQGEIKWFVENQDRESIWKEIKNLTDEGKPSNAIDESQLICLDEGRERIQIVIISGVAGTGKSTILSNYYMEMKRVKPDHWIIRINLVEQQTAFLELVTADKVVDFFVKQLHIAEDESPFSRSLLRHRIETGDRIAFMFDGFDEISHRCQQNVIRLMKILARKKTIKLYVTTRPHIADELQFELSQLAHHLQILAEKDQIDYLVRYWQSNLQEMEMENKSIIIQTFAESLAHRVSQTLRDEERAFIGVPLQCRILAECYQSELEKQIKNNNVAACQTLVHQHFDLKSLYERLLDTKRRIFREEKAESSSLNPIGSCAIDFLIDDIESHLTKLAIETLVVETKEVKILWPSQQQYFHSEAEISEKENKITDLGVKYGLIVRSKGDKQSKVQFLHRTYAEYLFALYLHRGMDINKFDNQLLDKKPVRDLVVNEILVEGHYHGVRVFLNSMLKTGHSQRTELPNQLQKLAKSLEEHITALPCDRHTNALIFTLPTQNLFYTLLNCLDGTLNETERKRVVRSAFQHPFPFFTFLYWRNGQLFQRVLSYYDDADAVDVERIVKALLHEPMTLRYSPDSYVIVWNNEASKDVVEKVLEFMEKNGENLKQVLNPEQSKFRPLHTSVTLLHFFIFNEYYNCLLSQFLRFLSSIYVDDRNFTELIKFTLKMQDYNNDNWTFPSNNGIEKTLDILRDLLRPRVMEGLCHFALVTGVFENYYQPFAADDEDSLRDPARMTRLHWAAFNGDMEAMESVGDWTCNVGDWTCSVDDSFTPFYVAAARHHKLICHKILSLLETSLTSDELKTHLAEYKGFVYTAMWDAVCFRNFKMFQLILESVKQSLGRHYLMALLKSEKPVDSFKTTQSDGSVSSSILALKNGKVLFKIIAQVLLEDGSQNGYTDLNDLVFNEKETVEIVLNNIEEETFQRMVDVNGLQNWTKRFLDYNVWGFRRLSTVIARFTLNQRREFINIITSPNIPTHQFNRMNVSYWGKWFENELTDPIFSNIRESLDKLLKSLEDDTPKLIFNYNSNDAIKALLCQNAKLVTAASKHFSWVNYFKFKRRVMKNGPKVMNVLLTWPLLIERKVVRNWINILPFYIGKKGKYHFGKLVNTILSLHTEKHGEKTIQISLWSKYLDSYYKVEKVDQFLKLVSDKLGKRAVRKVVLHKDCMGIVLLGAELQQDKKLVNALLTHLSDEDRDCIEHLLESSLFSSRRYTLDATTEPCNCQPMNDCLCWWWWKPTSKGRQVEKK
ncbi:uncharacterized protein LOC123471447 [Daphnia magna]|uniref:uncharacterized protein LOC123471447 n=1 Tax=Daphnia magna TaxID=35525 RepID=UPI001E1BC6F3|nr:uncharacterized protein LOC123471447 [Daphnia magna]